MVDNTVQFEYLPLVCYFVFYTHSANLQIAKKIHDNVTAESRLSNAYTIHPHPLLYLIYTKISLLNNKTLQAGNCSRYRYFCPNYYTIICLFNIKYNTTSQYL